MADIGTALEWVAELASREIDFLVSGAWRRVLPPDYQPGGDEDDFSAFTPDRSRIGAPSMRRTSG